MSNRPLVTVAAVSYNHAAFVIETLDSIKQQTYPNIELLIVDDCSTDESLSLIRNWLKDYDKPCKLVVHDTNQGSRVSHNEILETARGKYLAFIATDDVMVNTKIEDQVALMESAQEEVAMVYGDCMMINEKGEVMHESLFDFYKGKDFVPPSGDIFKNVLEGFYFYGQSALFNLHSIRKINYRFEEGILSEDWDIELELARNFTIIGSRKIWAKYRRLTTSITSSNWSKENYDKVYRSHFVMIEKFYRHQLNTKEDKALIVNKLREIYNRLDQCTGCSNNDRLYFQFRILRLTKSAGDLLTLLRILNKKIWSFTATSSGAKDTLAKKPV